MTGYRLTLIHEAPESREVSVTSFWDTEEDERASYQAIMPIGDQVSEVWAPAHSHTETYQRVAMPAAAMRLECGCVHGASTVECPRVAPFACRPAAFVSSTELPPRARGAAPSPSGIAA